MSRILFLFFLSVFLVSCSTIGYRGRLAEPKFDVIYVNHYYEMARDEFGSGNFIQCLRLCDFAMKNLLSIKRESLKTEELNFYDHLMDSICRLRLRAVGKIYPPKEENSDFPVVFNDRVEKWLFYYTGSAKKYFMKWLERKENYIDMVKEILRENGMPEELAAVPVIESGAYPFAVSKRRAVGLWQFIHPTGKLFGLERNHWFDERRDPEKSTIAACKMLKNLHNRFDDWFLALAAYNCGSNRVLSAIKKQKTRNFWDLYLPRETENYVSKIIAAMMIMRDPLIYGFPADFDSQMEYETVNVYGPVDLKKAARLIDVPAKDLIYLNPELSRQCTPPDEIPYPLKVPKGKASAFIEKFSRLPDRKKYMTKKEIQARKHSVIVYRVRRGDCLSRIARKYRVSVRKLKRWNRISRAGLIYPGQKLKIYR
ncbi:MAG: transglycosylase SLT domain-containing protein [Elusimicrobia bacterium]|nr:transglycosylase SLT domain-containing protein [Elusimicrobiota bacterium]